MFESSVTYGSNGVIHSAWIKEMEFTANDGSGESYERSIVRLDFNGDHDGIINIQVHEAYDPACPTVMWLTASQAEMLADILWEMAGVLNAEGRDIGAHGEDHE